MELKELTFGKMFKLAFKAVPAIFLAKVLWTVIVIVALIFTITAVCSIFDINPVYYLYQYLGIPCV